MLNSFRRLLCFLGLPHKSCSPRYNPDNDPIIQHQVALEQRVDRLVNPFMDRAVGTRR